MQRTIISGTVTHTVIVSPGGRYGSPLTITDSGYIAPITDGSAGVVVQADVENAAVTNNGIVVGGSSQTGQTGGTGVLFRGGGTLVNAGSIMGGSNAPETQGSGGTGVHLTGATVTNDGIIAGGYGGYSLGPQAVGHGGAGLILDGGSGQSVNSGTIKGAAGAYGHGAGGHGGVGVALTQAALSNMGTIAGGDGGTGYDSGARGAAGVDIQSGASLLNAGLITGGQGGYSAQYSQGGGNGIDLSGGMITNTGTVLGGAAGGSSNASPGNGGAGIAMSGGTLTNSGVVFGGAGGFSSIFDAGYSAGPGLVITGGSAIVSGTIEGGGASALAVDRVGGAGVYLDGGTLTTTAMISGGSGGEPDAVAFGSKPSTLILQAGASFVGLVAAEAGHGDQLVLGGDDTGTIAGLGFEFTGFAGIQEDAGATWTLIGSNVLGDANLSIAAGVLDVKGTLTTAGNAGIGQTGALAVLGSAALLVPRLVMAGGTLSGGNDAAIVLGSSMSGAQRGSIVIDSGAGLHGFGTLAGAPVIDDGALVAQNGALSLGSDLSGSGVAIIQSATLSVAGAISTANLNFQGPAALFAGRPAAITSEINGFGSGDVIDLQNLIATTFSFSGGTLTLDNGAMSVATLLFSGDLTAADFSLRADGHGGQIVSYTGDEDGWAFGYRGGMNWSGHGGAGGLAGIADSLVLFGRS
jgi:hypothetical protein